jgi:hypothetical protein
MKTQKLRDVVNYSVKTYVGGFVSVSTEITVKDFVYWYLLESVCRSLWGSVGISVRSVRGSVRGCIESALRFRK